MCNIMWLARIETEFSNRLRVLTLGLHYLEDIFRYLKIINIVLLLFQIVMRLREESYVHLFGYNFITFITMLSLAIWVVVLILLMYGDGSRHYYITTLKEIKKCKRIEGDTNKLRDYLHKERVIHSKCVRGVIYRKNRYLFNVTILVIAQLLIYCGQHN